MVASARCRRPIHVLHHLVGPHEIEERHGESAAHRPARGVVELGGVHGVAAARLVEPGDEQDAHAPGGVCCVTRDILAGRAAGRW